MPSNADAQPETLTFKAFLEGTPPEKPEMFSASAVLTRSVQNVRYVIAPPVLELYCATCEGLRSFESLDEPADDLGTNHLHAIILQFQCRNCEKHIKFFALLLHIGQGECTVYKIGEAPAFGPATPDRKSTR